MKTSEGINLLVYPSPLLQKGKQSYFALSIKFLIRRHVWHRNYRVPARVSSGHSRCNYRHWQHSITSSCRLSKYAACSLLRMRASSNWHSFARSHSRCCFFSSTCLSKNSLSICKCQRNNPRESYRIEANNFPDVKSIKYSVVFHRMMLVAFTRY